jgi:uncharacterized protein
MRTLLKSVIAALALLTAAPVMAQEIDKGMKAFQNGDFAAAISAWEPLAARGDTEAQLMLCKHHITLRGGVPQAYIEGKGPPEDIARGVAMWRTQAQWCLLASQDGSGEALAELGYLYSNGSGVEKDKARGLALYQLAVNRGDPLGQARLGFLHQSAQLEGGRNDKEAVRLYKLAAEQGHALGQFRLGLMYEYGLGVPQNMVHLMMWHFLSQHNGYDLDSSFGHEGRLEEMTEFQLKEAVRLANECLEKRYRNCG